jgi:hypothetical protein
MKQLLWLDDIRDPSLGDWLMCYAPQFAYGEGEVIWVKNYYSFVDWIKENGIPHMIAFDHDLGQDVANEKVEQGMSKRRSRREKRTEMSGFECAKWLVEYCLDNNVELREWTIQSANPVGVENINGLLNGFKNRTK